jgi:hypothetical protein
VADGLIKAQHPIQHPTADKTERGNNNSRRSSNSCTDSAIEASPMFLLNPRPVGVFGISNLSLDPLKQWILPGTNPLNPPLVPATADLVKVG